MLILSSLTGALVASRTPTKPTIEPIGKMGYSHIIISEYGTATWCGYCKYAHEALMKIYAGGWYPFYYISMVCDVNVNANNRAVELGLTGYPTVYFDGGANSVVGAGSVPSAMNNYNSSIKESGKRDVSDVDISLDVTWNGNAEMDIDVYVTNNEDDSYKGHLHVYVTEIVSSMGWYDTAGKLYTFPFLDYAFNQDITVSSGGTYHGSITWDGHDYYTGYGDDFGDITYGNIMIIGTVFNQTSKYSDDSTGYRVGNNNAPKTPKNPNPGDNATDVDVYTDLNWTCNDPDNDVLLFDVYLDTSTPPKLVKTNNSGQSYTPGVLDLNSTYYWKIDAKDPHGATTSGPIWRFTTRGNDPPNKPSDPEPANGETDVDIDVVLHWTSEDPDGDDVTYDVYFGDSSPPPKVKSNKTGSSYNPSGELDFEKTYYWKIVSWDEFNYSSEGSLWSFTTEENLPPYEPSNPDPADGETNVNNNADLSWTGGDPNSGDKLTFDVYFGKTNPPPLSTNNQTFINYNPGAMDLGTTYYWKIVSWDSQGLTTKGPIWEFTTSENPNYPPKKPTISGETKGKAGEEYEYIVSATDPNDDDLKYIIDWGDGNEEETTFYGSGEDVTISHIWEEKDTYVITVKAEDPYGLDGPEATLEVSMPKSKGYNFNFNFFERFFERFPNALPLLRYLLGI